jgi:surface protein
MELPTIEDYFVLQLVQLAITDNCYVLLSRKTPPMLRFTSVLKSSRAAIDLASIMVGVIIIGLIGGVIAATIFAVIPWSQDKAAKQQLDSIHTAENVFFGLSSDPSQNIAGEVRNSFTDSAGLSVSNLLEPGENYCVVATTDGKDYDAYVRSASGKIFTAKNSNRTASQVVEATGTSVQTCLGPIADNSTNPPASDAGAYKTVLTVNCPTEKFYTVPVTGLTGEVSWALAGSEPEKMGPYANADYPASKKLLASTNYVVTITGTYKAFNSYDKAGVDCLRSVDSWGAKTEVSSTRYAFYNADNLTFVAAPPTTVTDMGFMFYSTGKFTQNLNDWDVSNVKNMSAMFRESVFNGDISNWNVSSITTFNSMFFSASSFDRDLSSWNTSNATSMNLMFNNATKFKSNLSQWNVSKVPRGSGFDNTGTSMPLSYLPKFSS